MTPEPEKDLQVLRDYLAKYRAKNGKASAVSKPSEKSKSKLEETKDWPNDKKHEELEEQKGDSKGP